MTEDTPRRTGIGGFSLIEVLVVLTIISLIVGTSTLALKSGRDRRQPVDVAKEIYGLTTSARYRAMNTAQNQTVEIDIPNRKLFSLSDNDAVQIPTEWELSVTIGRIPSKPDGMRKIEFLPDGTSSGAEIVLGATDRSDKTVVRVNWLTGITEIYESETKRTR
ncbi:prepilin-type N-terminal cleavage/methylation domain-containing protein [Rhizobium sp. PP-CC-3G-465]|uniref:prepilin-type N-terminal cleavage/methylation domain-containing protein n=1 Tax=Rhizobium sp. PP-CC-3G-465 TaxID=2135648 RepID=UPI001042D8EC|nr:general secretion pathway protein H [Rhizobium sp. PP-CC-3G-465]